MSVIPVAMLLMRLPSGIGDSVATFTTLHQRFGPAINRLRSAVLGVSKVLSPPPPVSYRPTWDADFRVYEILVRFSDASKGGRRTLSQRISRRSAYFVRI